MIVVFGSLNADLVFDVAEAPLAGQTVAARAFHVEAGGKGGNQAVAAARDGARVAMIGAVGQDANGTMLLDGLAAGGVDVSRVARVGAPTGCAAIQVAEGGENRIIVVAGANAEARADLVDDDLLASASSLLLQMETPVAEVEKLIFRARQSGVRSIFNMAPAIVPSLEALRACGILIVNETEADTLAARLATGSSAGELRSALGCDVVRTLGGEGVDAATAEGTLRLPARSIDVVDATAAGDCFVGVLAAAFDRGLGFAAAVERAVAASALACTRRGAQASLPSAGETDALLARAD